MNIRKQVYQNLKKVGNSYAVNIGDKTITAKIVDHVTYDDLEVAVTNNKTNDRLVMTDEQFEVTESPLLFDLPFLYLIKCFRKGVNKATYNGFTNGTGGMDEKFDEALKVLKPRLEEQIEKNYQEVIKNVEIVKKHCT